MLEGVVVPGDAPRARPTPDLTLPAARACPLVNAGAVCAGRARTTASASSSTSTSCATGSSSRSLALVVAFAVAYGFHEQLIELLEQPLPQKFQDSGLITLSPTEPFFVTLKVCFWAAILVALPVWLYQLYAFVIPAVQDQSRRRMLLIVAGVSALFVGGVAFGFFVVLPVALQFLLNFGGDAFQTQVRAGEYFGFATTLMLGVRDHVRGPHRDARAGPPRRGDAPRSTSASGASPSW